MESSVHSLQIKQLIREVFEMVADPLDSFLSGLKPELTDGFDVLEGTYRCVVKNEPKAETGFITGTFPSGDTYERFQLTVDVTDVLKGNGNPGRRLWLRYNKDEAGLQKLLNDLFTGGVIEDVDRTSVESLKETLPNLAGKMLYVRAWAWTPEKNRDGLVIPEDQRVARQQTAIKSERALKKLLAEKSETPF